MSFTDTRQTSGRTAILATVAVFHGAVFYALVSGLGATYVEHIVPGIKARNIPADPPKPEPVPEPPATDEAAKQESVVRAPDTTIDLARSDDRLRVPDVGEVITPLEPDFGDIDILPPPKPTPPRFAPTRAQPRTSPGRWVTSNDYPTRDIRQGNEGSVGFRLEIDARGKVSACDVIRSSGHAGLDAATCKLVTQRARFEAATDTTGKPVAGSYTNTIVWVIPD